MMIFRICEDFHSPENMKPNLSTHITPLSLEISKLGIKQKIYAINSEIDTLNNINIKRIPIRRPFSFLRTGLFTYKQIKKETEKPDIIHYHNPRFSSILLKKKKLPPIVMTIHDSPKNIIENITFNNTKNTKESIYYYYFSKWASKKLDALICVSPDIKSDLIRRWNLNPEKVHTAKSGVNTKIFYPENNKKTIELLYVGRLVEKKRPIDFVRIVSRLKNKNPKIKAIMIGSNKNDPLYNTIYSEIKNQKLSKNITLISNIPQEKLKDYYNTSRILILPSISEGTSKVLLESMACETPIITTKISGNKSICHNGKTGYLVKPKDIDGFVEKAEQMLNNPNHIEKIGKQARKFVEKEHSWNTTAKIHFKIYEKLIEK